MSKFLTISLFLRASRVWLPVENGIILVAVMYTQNFPRWGLLKDENSECHQKLLQKLRGISINYENLWRETEKKAIVICHQDERR